MPVVHNATRGIILNGPVKMSARKLNHCSAAFNLRSPIQVCHTLFGSQENFNAWFFLPLSLKRPLELIEHSHV